MMNKELITTLQNEFNQLSNTLEDTAIEYWYARDLQKILGYNSWDKFQNVIEKAKTACKNSGVEVADHFRQVGKMVQIGSDANKKIENIEKMLKLYKDNESVLEFLQWEKKGFESRRDWE